MTIASDLLQRHIQALVEDNAQWQTLIADDLLCELPYAPAIGHPSRPAAPARRRPATLTPQPRKARVIKAFNSICDDQMWWS